MRRRAWPVVFFLCLAVFSAPARAEVDIQVRAADGKNTFVPGEYLWLIVDVRNGFSTPVGDLRISSNQGSAVVLSQPVPAGKTAQFRFALAVHTGDLRLVFTEARLKQSRMRFQVERRLTLKRETKGETGPPLPVAMAPDAIRSVRPDVFSLFQPADLSSANRLNLFIVLGFLVVSVVIAGIFIPRRWPILAAAVAIALAIGATGVAVRLVGTGMQRRITQQAVVWVTEGNTQAVRQTFLALTSRGREKGGITFRINADALPRPLAYEWEDLFENHLHIVWKDNAPENVYTASGLRKGEVRILSIQQKILLESAAGLKEGVAAASRPEDVQTPVTIRDGVLLTGDEAAPGGHGAAFAWWERHFRRPGRTYLVGLSDALPRLKVASPQAVVKVLPTLWVFDISPASAKN